MFGICTIGCGDDGGAGAGSAGGSNAGAGDAGGADPCGDSADLCDGTCRDLTSDPDACGACDTKCPPGTGRTCRDAQCLLEFLHLSDADCATSCELEQYVCIHAVASYGFDPPLCEVEVPCESMPPEMHPDCPGEEAFYDSMKCTCALP